MCEVCHSGDPVFSSWRSYARDGSAILLIFSYFSYSHFAPHAKNTLIMIYKKRDFKPLQY